MVDCLRISLFAGMVFVVLARDRTTDDRLCSLITIYGLKTAECMGFNLTGVPRDLDSDLKTLNLHKNQISHLADYAFQNYSSLQNLHLVNNRIKKIDDNAFQNLRNLQILDLESNHLNTVPKFAFRPLLYLRILSFNNNPITHISSDDLVYLPQIETLKFENCRLEKIDSSAFRPLTRLFELNIANNQLKHLDYQLANSFDSLTVLRLYNNVWHCDCRLRWLRVSVQAIPNWDFGTNSPFCEAPDLLRGVNWKHLSPDKFACPSIIYSMDNHQNASNVEITWGGNASIDCVAWGDPEPLITWMKNGKAVDPRLTSQHTFYASSLRSAEDKNVRGILNIVTAKRSDEGSYKCIAENSAGRSEVTYKVWLVEKKSANLLENTFRGGRMILTYEVILGVILGCVLLLGSLLVCLVCVVSRRQRARKIVKRRKSNKKHRQLLVNDKHVNFKSDSKSSSSCDQLIGNSFEFDADKINCQVHDATQASDDKLSHEGGKPTKNSMENLSDVNFKHKKISGGRKSFFASSKKIDKKKQNVRPDILSNQNVAGMQLDSCGISRKNFKTSARESADGDNSRHVAAKCNKSKVTQFTPINSSNHCNNPICNKPILKPLHTRQDSDPQKSKIPNSDRVPLKKILKAPSATFDKAAKEDKLMVTSNQNVVKSNRPPDIYATLPARSKLVDQNMKLLPVKPIGAAEETSDFLRGCDNQLLRDHQMDAPSNTPAHNIEHLLIYDSTSSYSPHLRNITTVSRFQVNHALVRSAHHPAPPCYSSATDRSRESSVITMRRYRNSTTDVRTASDSSRNSNWTPLSKRQDASSSTSLHEILSPPFKKSPVIYPKQTRPPAQVSVHPARKKGDYVTAV